jgi:hypothetical protein
MVPLFHVFSLVWHSVIVCCCAAEPMRCQTGFSSRHCGRVSDSVGGQAMRMRSRSENAARVECLAENAGNFDDFQEKRAARVECLAKNTRNFDDFDEKGAARVECLAKKSRGILFGPVPCRFWFPASRSIVTCRGEGNATGSDNEPTTPKLMVDTALDSKYPHGADVTSHVHHCTIRRSCTNPNCAGNGRHWLTSTFT